MAGSHSGVRFKRERERWAIAAALWVLCTTVPAGVPGRAAQAPRDPRLAPPPAGEVSKTEDIVEIKAQFLEQLAKRPNDVEALLGLAAAETRWKNYPAAIQEYQRVLEFQPNNRVARLKLAQVLGFAGRYDDAVRLYKEMLDRSPADPEALEGLGQVYAWSGRTTDARSIFEGLAAGHPTNLGYRIELARLETRLKHYAVARSTLTGVLSADPANREARLRVAELELFQGHLPDAGRQFNQLLHTNPTDSEALLGNARVAYYQGDLRYARQLAASLVEEQPDDFEAVFLLASIERALHNRRAARELLARAGRLNPNSVDVSSVERSLREESRTTFHTSTSFARELGSASGLSGMSGSSQADLRSFGYETTLRFSALPRTDSYFSLYYLPSSSPSGGTRGAVAPWQFLYRQTTWISPRLTLRGGAAMVYFGPGGHAIIPSQTQPILTPELGPQGFANLSYAPGRKVSLDLTASYSPITYTPTAVHLGVEESRLAGGFNLFFRRRADLRLEYFFAHYDTTRYDHVSIVNRTTQVIDNKSDRDQAQGGSALFNCNLIRSRPFSFEVGYSGLAYGYIGHRHNITMGFFNPSFYQRHYLTARLAGTLGGPVGYDFSGGIGVQQVEQGTALTRALVVSPAFTLKVSRRLTIGLGYTHYNSAQSLGILRGNAVRLTTDWTF